MSQPATSELPLHTMRTPAYDYFKDGELAFPDLQWFVDRHALWLGESDDTAGLDISSLPESDMLVAAQKRGWEQVQFLGVVVSMNGVQLERYINDDCSDTMSRTFYEKQAAAHDAELKRITGFESATILRAPHATEIRQTALQPALVLATSRDISTLEVAYHDSGITLLDRGELYGTDGFTNECDFRRFHNQNPYHIERRADAAATLRPEDTELIAAVHNDLRSHVITQLQSMELGRSDD